MKISHDVNGNKVLKIESSDIGGARGFSVQTSGNLPRTHKDGVNKSTWCEVKLYLLKHGTNSQKSKIDLFITHDEYMSNSGHENWLTYHLQFAHSGTYQYVLNTFGMDKLLSSKDEHLNDLCKHSNNGAGNWLWDFAPINHALVKKSGTWVSYSTITSVAKAAAFKLINDHKQKA